MLLYAIAFCMAGVDCQILHPLQASYDKAECLRATAQLNGGRTSRNVTYFKCYAIDTPAWREVN